ncbi:MAG: ATP synthase F1 subunit delta [Acholeplasmataceae bacterium]|jgi:F-type H+-transporting ATPase subunit delta
MRKYAKALHQIALERNKLDVLNYQFDQLKDLIKDNSRWIEMMDSPMITDKEKEANIDNLDFDDVFLSFLKTLSKKRHMTYIFEIYEEWTHLVRTTQKIAHLNVITASKMTQEQENRLLEVLKPRFKNQTISLHKIIDPSLIGGIKVIYQGQSLDRSVARELEELFTTI